METRETRGPVKMRTYFGGFAYDVIFAPGTRIVERGNGILYVFNADGVCIVYAFTTLDNLLRDIVTGMVLPFAVDATVEKIPQ